jgi:hypothetical protein
MNQVIEQAIEFLTNRTTTSATPEAVVEALLITEKTAKQTKVRYSYPQLLGTWRLGFITGTKRTRQRAGVILGAGRFLPPWVKIQLSYSQLESNQERGNVQNSVEIGPLQLILTGPTQFWQKTNILAFDFTQIKVSLSNLKLYEGYIRGGQNREAIFWEQNLKDQAFFSYFLVDNLCIAARGRGGGLALWTKVNDK